ncbi:hypothetical protein [Oscillatoria acuminata]|nr:hypothetical protein [Oscillatoria acuminata]
MEIESILLEFRSPPPVLPTGEITHGDRRPTRSKISNLVFTNPVNSC